MGECFEPALVTDGFNLPADNDFPEQVNEPLTAGFVPDSLVCSC